MTSARPAARRFAALGAALLTAGSLAAVLAPARSEGAPGPNNTTLTMHKAADRTSPQVVSGLAGTTFDFYAGIAGTPPTPGTTPVAASCTTVADGTCSVDVAGRTGGTGNNVQGYWVIERTAPAGYTAPQSLDTGAGPTVSTVYNRYFTGNVSNNVGYNFPQASTGNTNPLAREDTWADIRNNPALPDRCGLNIALLIDVSGSIIPDLQSVKDAANGFVDALTGTPSKIALYSFATGADALLGPTPVPDAAGADTVKAAINALVAGGGTNWDSGLFQIAAATSTYDAVVMLTDGNPTFYGPNSEGPGNYTRFREVENGIFSANAIKALGTKIVAVGVGAGISGSAQNLQAISGPVVGVDYVQTGYAALAAVFREIALRTCAGTISVVKKVIPPGGVIADALPTGGWTFSTATGGVTPATGDTAADTGAVSFTATLGGAASLPVTITETAQPDHTLEQVGGNNATCTSDGNPVTATNSGALGFTVDALRNAIVTCTVYNRTTIPPASVQVNKVWSINGTSYNEPAQPSEFQSALELTGQTVPTWGQVYAGYQAGDSVTIGETVNQDLLPPGCTNTPSGDLGAKTLAAGTNTYTVTNTVVCTTSLKLLKEIVNPYGPPQSPLDAWTLMAYPTGSNTPAITGTTGISGTVTANSRYALGETAVAGYVQERAPGSVINPPSTGTWHCVLRLRDGTLGPEYDGLNGGVTVQLGQQAECTAKNIAQKAKLTLKKTVDNTHGGTAVPTDWLLEAAPQPGNPDAVLISGRDGQPAVTGAAMIPNLAYTLDELAGPIGYDEVGLPVCLLTGTQTPVDTPGSVLTALIGQDITCTFTNADREPPPSPSPSVAPPPPPVSPSVSPSVSPPPIPVTGMALTGIAGGGLLAIGIGVVLLFLARRRKFDGDDAELG
ncbi:hypothetical protein F4553_000381 [Allocatelliglobosispora scoriae]|uniref:VWFA domain-containing protein n=1 Tax=Allocatelliglobosispora scoriae TaxID=643052 RepID=A0A841BJP4_9ACTN|nr:VWA domain-containing protein [Allocatelliglobosispora scoriae]MBB5867002.1 hypothetical protein [Allocatelliglobosispora scoriae]